ncbi:hypothetical protein Tco_1506750 [Tanacetum coccineum]
MSSATSDVTYTSVYTDSEPGRAFWGADYEEISEGGIPRVIVLGYDGLPLQPVAPPSPDYILGPENLQILPVPQDEDEREPMFIQAHDPDYVPEPIYPEYIPLEDDHEFPAEEQPLPPIDSPTTESPGYVTESDPEEDPEEYEDDETEDGPVDYPMDGGDDGDDDDGDSSRDDARDEDEEDEEEEEHLAPGLNLYYRYVPDDEAGFPLREQSLLYHHPPDITIGARITVRPQTSISLPPEAEVERLLTMTTPSPSPPYITITTLCRGFLILSALLVTAAIYPHSTTTIPPSHPCLSLLTVKDDFPSLISLPEEVDDERGDRGLEMWGLAPSLRCRLELRSGFRFNCMGNRGTLQETSWYGRGSEAYASRGLGLDTRTHATAAEYFSFKQLVAPETLRVIRDMRREMSDMQAELLALREQQRRARHPGPEARIPDHQEASGDADSHI